MNVPYAGQVAAGIAGLDGSTLTGIVVTDDYELDLDHATAADVAFFESQAAGYARLTATASVERIDAEWVLFLDDVSSTDLSEEPARGGVVWVGPGGSDAARATVFFAPDPGGEIDPYSPTYDDGAFSVVIESVVRRLVPDPLGPDQVEAGMYARVKPDRSGWEAVAVVAESASMATLTDVDLVNFPPEAGQAPVWDPTLGAQGKWRPGTVATSGSGPVDLIEAPAGELTVIPVEAGEITQPVAYVAALSGEPCIEYPNAADHEGARVGFLSLPDAASPGAWSKVPAPTTGTANINGLFAALIGAIGEGNSVDLTTSTLGHPFISRGMVDGVEEPSAALDDVYGPVTSGDGYAELQRLVADLLAPHFAAGVTTDGISGILESPTSGYPSAVGFHPDQEEIAGVDIAAVVASDAVDGINGYLIGMTNAEGGALGHATYYPAGWIVYGAGTHLHEGLANNALRSWEWISVPWPDAPHPEITHIWSPVGTGAVRDEFVSNSHQDNRGDQRTLNAVFRALYEQGLADGPHQVTAIVDDDVSTLERLPAGRSALVVETDTNLTIDPDEHSVVVATDDSITVTLPPLAAHHRYTVVNASAGSIDLAPDGSDEIDGTNTAASVAAGTSLTVIGTHTAGWRTT